jgi:hypothetical protein
MPVSRRSLMTSAAVLPALTIPAVPAVASMPEPIGPDLTFAAIETHRAAVLGAMTACRILGRLGHDDPRRQDAQAAAKAAYEAAHNAQCELANVVPTTIAAASALLAHVEDMHASEIELPLDPRRRHFTLDDHVGWDRNFTDEEMVSWLNGKPLELPLTFRLIRNVLQAAILGCGTTTRPRALG